MSHIFISYAHHDKPHLDRIMAWLNEHDFAERELWYDHHIEGGNNWRDEIAAALDEAFVVVVVVTAHSVKSLYCTYEWAYAMGQGITILPLLFENLAITDIPSPLASKQFTDCIQGIPEALKDQIARLRSVPPQVAAINRSIYEAINDTHRRFFILGWIGWHSLHQIDDEIRQDVMAYFESKASEAYHTLQTLMTDKAFIFSGKQYRYCWTIMDFLKEFSQLHRKAEGYLQDHLFLDFESKWLPAFEYFEGHKRQRIRRRKYSDDWDLKTRQNRIEVFAEIIRLFSFVEASEAELLVDNLLLDQKSDESS